MINIPITNAGLLYITGMSLSFVDGTTVAVSAGQCRDHTNVNDILTTASANINVATPGIINSLDTGTLAPNKLYYVWAVADSSKFQPTGFLISLSMTQPTLPFGYDMFRRIGAVLTNATAAPNTNVLKFYQTGDDALRTMWYDVAYATDITTGSSATYAPVNITVSVPAAAIEVVIYSVFTPTAGGDKLQLRPTGASAVNGYAVLSGSVAAVAKTGHLRLPCNATPSIDYKVTGSATALSVQGYIDQL